jgi:hypothetical protein
MDSHGWVFWVVIPFFFFVFFRGGRRWGNPSMHRKMKRTMQQHIRAGARPDHADLDYKQDEELAEHRHYIDELEKRVAELENRLDFTERLLAGRRESVAQESQELR